MIKVHTVPKKAIEYVIFNIRWLLIPFLLKLIWNILLLMYIFFVKEGLPKEQLIATLEALDIVMVAALIEMVITGIYNSHINKEHGYPGKNITSGILKVKMGTSLVGVSSIDILKAFLSVKPVEWDELWKKIVIHIAFILGAFALMVIDKIHVKSEAQELLNEEKEHELEEKHKNQNKKNENTNAKPAVGHNSIGLNLGELH